MRASVFIVAGTRPNFMKIAPVLRALSPYADMLKTTIVHTGQHYDDAMSGVFLDELGIPEPDHRLEVGSGSHAYQTAQVMLGFEKLLHKHTPDLILVVGDVNSTVAAAMTAVKLHIPVAHVEAGLRSFDRRMPEEINRILTDRISSLLFATEPAAVKHLAHEGVDAGTVHLVGNVMIDELMHALESIRARRAAAKLNIEGRPYGLATIHRPANVDTEAPLRTVLTALRAAAERSTVVFPVHPRTAKTIEAFGLRPQFEEVENLQCIAPQGYLDFMSLLDDAEYVLTDSGGIQVEAAWLGTPCITLRPTTEHVLTVEQGRNRLTGLEPVAIRQALDWAGAFDPADRPMPMEWDGKAAERIATVLVEFLTGA